MANRYVLVTALSTFRIKYAIHEDDLLKMADATEATDDQLIEWANDTVVSMEAEEMSQEWMGEIVLDNMICNEEYMLQTFDKENEYLKGWTVDQKIRSVRRAFVK
jgi:hypothetical protein